MTTTVFCPHCNHVFDLKGREAVSGLPPTGGDYEWVRAESERQCPHCQNSIKLRLESQIGTGRINAVCESPKPQNPDIVWYAWAKVDKLIESLPDWYVSVYSLHQTYEEAERCKPAYPAKLLKVSHEGYQEFSGELLQEALYDQDVICFSMY
jgi:rubredoxin